MGCASIGLDWTGLDWSGHVVLCAVWFGGKRNARAALIDDGPHDAIHSRANDLGFHGVRLLATEMAARFMDVFA